MAEKKPQILIRFKQGDHAVFDIGSEAEFQKLKKNLNDKDAWLFIGPTALVKKEELDRLFYLPEGYAQNSPSSVPQS